MTSKISETNGFKAGTSYNTRHKSNTIIGMDESKREVYIKGFIATCNAEMLIPFINITKHDELFRKINCEIDVLSNSENDIFGTDVTIKSQSQAKYISDMCEVNRDDYVKRFIATCNADKLIPFITITKCDKAFRKIEYEIDVTRLLKTHAEN